MYRNNDTTLAIAFDHLLKKAIEFKWIFKTVHQMLSCRTIQRVRNSLSTINFQYIIPEGGNVVTKELGNIELLIYWFLSHKNIMALILAKQTHCAIWNMVLSCTTNTFNAIQDRFFFSKYAKCNQDTFFFNPTQIGYLEHVNHLVQSSLE